MFSWRNKKNISTFLLKKKRALSGAMKLDALWAAKDSKFFKANSLLRQYSARVARNLLTVHFIILRLK